MQYLGDVLAVIGHEDILKLMKQKQPLIENADEKNIQPSGVDLRVKCVYRLKNGGYLGVENRKTPDVEVITKEIGKNVVLRPNEFVLVETMEKVNMPKDVMAIVLPRSSLFRCGASLHTAVVDPGFVGTLTFGMKNLSNHSFEIEIGSKIGQIVFEEVKGNTKLYDGKYQGGKVT
jgi:deoxycytidine triphosphate deaminase